MAQARAEPVRATRQVAHWVVLNRSLGRTTTRGFGDPFADQKTKTT
jgi:hypothetical protein